MGDRFFISILANARGARRVLYTGVTNDLEQRIAEHRRNPTGFVARYRVTSLVYFESTAHGLAAIAREKQIKGWGRAKKIALIEHENPLWDDLLPDNPTRPGDPSSLRSSG